MKEKLKHLGYLLFKSIFKIGLFLILFDLLLCVLLIILNYNKSDDIEWSVYTDKEHGFSVEIPAIWKSNYWSAITHEEQTETIFHTYTISECTNAEDYLKKEIFPHRSNGIEKWPNKEIDGFIVHGIQLDNITPGCEAVIVNCPYLIRLRVNFSNYKDPQKLFNHMVSSVKTWSI
jgi:hypothetical protein